MIDPGSYTVEAHSKEKNIDLILITHEHPDHFDLESIKEILKNNPQGKIVTNIGVGKILDKAGIKYSVLENKISTMVSGVEIEAHDCKHQEIFEDIGQVKNTAYFVDKKLFYPGDSLFNPEKSIEILALPVAGPWTDVKNAMRCVLEIKPKICFPVHDGMLKSFGSSHRVPALVLPKFNILFKNFEENNEEEF